MTGASESASPWHSPGPGNSDSESESEPPPVLRNFGMSPGPFNLKAASEAADPAAPSESAGDSESLEPFKRHKYKIRRRPGAGAGQS